MSAKGGDDMAGRYTLPLLKNIQTFSSHIVKDLEVLDK